MALSSSRGNAIFLCIMAVALTIGNAELNIGSKESACKGRSIALTGDYAHAVTFALNEVISNVPKGDYNYYGLGSYMHGTTFTHARCNGGLDKEECRTCAEIAKGYLVQDCAFHTEGWFEVMDCFISWWEFPNK